MTIRTVSPWGARQFEDFFNDFNRWPAVATNTAEFSPAVDIDEQGHNYLVTADLPGLKKEDIKIELDDNVLTISGERIKEVKTETKTQGKYTERYEERVHGKFHRAFRFPVHVAADKVQASFEAGVLTITVPKAEGARSQTIKIQ